MKERRLEGAGGVKQKRPQNVLHSHLAAIGGKNAIISPFRARPRVFSVTRSLSEVPRFITTKVSLFE